MNSSKQDTVKKGQIWTTTDKRRGYRIVVLGVKGAYALVESIDKSKGGTAKAQRKVKLSRFSPHSGLKLLVEADAYKGSLPQYRVYAVATDAADALTKDTETLGLPDVPPAVLREFAELPPASISDPIGRRVETTFSLPAPVMTIPAPAGAEKDVHEEVTAEHPILR